jgi:hypothetical protein
MTPKNWQDVLLRREYLRGWLDGWRDSMSVSLNIQFSAELASLEALKPCAV